MMKPCHFEDSDFRCWDKAPAGICGRPPNGGAPALVQYADADQLCARDPPYGMRPMCSTDEREPGFRLLRRLRDPPRCWHPTCALVGASGTLLGARLGKEIDSHSAVIRVNFAPDGLVASRTSTAPHRHLPTWIADVGARTTWRVLTMEGYGYLRHYPRFWLQPPQGHGSHANMSGIPQHPRLAISCHTPTARNSLGRCRLDRLRQVFDHPWSASYMINPTLMDEVRATHFRGTKNQKTLSTGMTAVAFARRMCGRVHLYGFGNGSCGDQCYHYYDCGATAGSAGVNQSQFLESASASGGFHNFSAQASVLLRMVAERQLTAHWGRCDRNFGNAPANYVNAADARAARRPAGGRRGRRGRGGGGGGGGGSGGGGGRGRRRGSG